MENNELYKDNYIVVEGKTVDELRRKVDKHIQESYKLQGGVCVANTGSDLYIRASRSKYVSSVTSVKYYQAMFKDKVSLHYKKINEMREYELETINTRMRTFR